MMAASSLQCGIRAEDEAQEHEREKSNNWRLDSCCGDRRSAARRAKRRGAAIATGSASATARAGATDNTSAADTTTAAGAARNRTAATTGAEHRSGPPRQPG